MSCILTCVGQAGNQIGAATLRYTGPWTRQREWEGTDIHTHAHTHTRGGSSARSTPSGIVCIDSEPKVIRPFLSPTSPSHIPYLPANACVVDQNGRGNNWAWGYTGVAAHRARVLSPSGEVTGALTEPLWKRGMEALRRQVESCDSFRSMVITHSLGGGTGSGLGSRLLEAIREEYPKSCLISACVAPFSSGDTPLQYINMALTLATVHETCDAVVFFDNDDLMHRARTARKQRDVLASAATFTPSSVAAVRAQIRAERSGKAGAEEGRVTTAALNDVVAQSIAECVLPVHTRQPLGAAGHRRDDKPDPLGRPAWRDVRDVEGEPSERDPLDFGRDKVRRRDLEDDDADDGRTAWMHGASYADAAESSATKIDLAHDADSVAAAARARLRLHANTFNAEALVSSLVPSGVHKYIDVRSVTYPIVDIEAPRGSAAHGATGSSFGWMEMADLLGDVVPRYDRDGRPVTALSARVIARGASQNDCDSVDPSLPASATAESDAKPSLAGGIARRRAAERAASRWPGLPETEEWALVGQKLHRMYTFAPDAGESFRSAVLTPAPVLSSKWATAPRINRSLTVAANSDVMLPTLLHCVERVETLVRAGAYLHWYARFGVTTAHIKAAAESVLNVVEAYSEVAPAAARRGMGGPSARRRI